MSARFAVGIDLGTTHCSLAQAELGVDGVRPEPQRLTQLVARDRVASELLLPSFIYFPHASEGALALPWLAQAAHAVGAYARRRGAEAPTRVVSSAKSWLSASTVDRHALLLPLSAPEDITKISAIEASFRLLDHMAEAWASARGDGVRLGEQDVVLTVPASFDAAAREATVEAALAAGLDHLTLLEEPQAAFYAWLDQRGEAWRSELELGDVVLIIDVGGGTTDLTAILLTEEEGRLEPRRIAVGQHILLGGDNMDLALAHLAKQKLESRGSAIDSWQLAALTHASRDAKEQLLSAAAPATVTVVVPNRGSQLLGGSLRCELTRDEVEQYLVEGFFPRVPLDAEPRQRPRTALRQQGLRYADDAALTTHLAAFLRQHRGALSESLSAGRPLLAPTHVLFNGGVFKSERLRSRLMETLNAWLAAMGAASAKVLATDDYDLAVARGAAYYGLVRRGQGVRVRGGTAQAYYVGIESPAPAVPGMDPPTLALCVAPFGMEEGSSVELPEVELGVVVGESVTFRFFGSNVRRTDAAGTLLDNPERQLEELAPIAITLPADGRTPGEMVAVSLRATITEVGTLALQARPLEPRAPDEHWKVELGLRSAGQAER
jgi:molecular chaperone DnaK (HSP70)